MALAPDGAVVTAGISDAPDGRQPVITLTGVNTAARRVDIAKIPGAVEPQVAVNSIAAQGSTQVAVGSANGYPAAWTSGNGGSTWNRAVGALPAVFGRPGSQRLTSVTHGPMGWLAVGDVRAAAPEHPVVVVSADGTELAGGRRRARLRRVRAVHRAGGRERPGLRHRRPPERQAGTERPRRRRPHRGRGLVVGHPDRLAARRGRHRGRARRDR